MGKCQVCGKGTRFNFPLCKDCNELKEQGKIVQCPDCGKWNEKDVICDCKKSKEESKPESELTCIICGENSNGKHFCFECWKKYHEKSIDIRITHCSNIQILDEYGNKTKKAKDGRFVRSLSEKVILDYFFDNYIRVVYEKSIPYTNEKGEEKELHPDFYLKDYDLYIEFNGLTNKTYLKMKNYVNKIYQEKGLKVEILESSDIDDIEKTMEKLLAKYQKK